MMNVSGMTMMEMVDQRKTMAKRVVMSFAAQTIEGLTLHGELINETPLYWVIDEVHEEGFRIKYPGRCRLLNMPKSAWNVYAKMETA
jgi:hypothetical protein